MLVRIYFFILGYAEIYIRGFSYGRVINMLKNTGIYAIGVQNACGGVKLRILNRDIKKTENMCKKAGCIFETVGGGGLPKIFALIRLKWVFTAGAVFFCCFLLTVTRFIWLVEVNGNYRVPTGRIVEFCSKNNLHYGARKSVVDTNGLEKKIKNEFEDISFVSVSIKGTRALIVVSETIPKKDEKAVEEPGDIVSDSRAIVTKVTARRGKPVVKEGMAVNKGDMLINADVDIKAEQEVLGTKAVRAEGEVYGKVLESYKFEVSFEESYKKYSKATYNEYYFEILGKKISLKCNKTDTNNKKCDKIISRKQLRLWNDIYLPFIVTKNSFRPYEYKTRRLSAEQARAKARRIVTAEIINNYLSESDVLENNITFKETDEGLLVAAEVLVNRQIGVFKEYERNTEDGKTQN